MAAPSPAVRAVTYERDGEQCVSCGTRTHLEYQHRRRVGMGGSHYRPGLVDGVTTCRDCNPRYESDWQDSALAMGWKVRSWVTDCSAVPVYYQMEREWYRLDKSGKRYRLTEERAKAMMKGVYGFGWPITEEKN